MITYADAIAFLRDLQSYLGGGTVMEHSEETFQYEVHPTLMLPGISFHATASGELRLSVIERVSNGHIWFVPHWHKFPDLADVKIGEMRPFDEYPSLRNLKTKTEREGLQSVFLAHYRQICEWARGQMNNLPTQGDLRYRLRVLLEGTDPTALTVEFLRTLGAQLPKSLPPWTQVSTRDLEFVVSEGYSPTELKVSLRYKGE